MTASALRGGGAPGLLYARKTQSDLCLKKVTTVQRSSEQCFFLFLGKLIQVIAFWTRLGDIHCLSSSKMIKIFL